MDRWKVHCVYCGYASEDAADEATAHRLRAAHVRKCDALVEIGSNVMIARVDDTGREFVRDYSSGGWIETRFEVVNERARR